MAKPEIACVAVDSNGSTHNSTKSCSFCGQIGRTKRGYCERHYRAFMRNGDPAIVHCKQQRHPCNWMGCTQPTRAYGFCRSHFLQAKKEGRLDEGKALRHHPLYGIWWARRQSNVLSPEWQDDFQQFIADVGEKPGKFYTLVSLRDAPFGPDNFRWREQIKRHAGEGRRAFYARKWQAQVQARPAWSHQRDLARKYGLTPEGYQAMLVEQNGLCAICARPETKIDHRLGTLRRLAVDHCHSTEKVRGLLCSICNMSIGQIGESIVILRAMIAYIEKHSQPTEPQP